MSRYQQKIIERYYEHKGTINANRLAEIVSDLYLTDSPSATAKLWDRAAKALAGAEVDPKRIEAVIKARDVQALAKLAGELSVGSAKPAGGSTSEADKPATATSGAATGSHLPTADDPTSPETLKAAYKAFKKRLKLNRLDEESRLGRSPLSGGQRSQIVAIQPPRDYPAATWEALVKQGKLKASGRGFYELA